jgi:hypothetical protein
VSHLGNPERNVRCSRSLKFFENSTVAPFDRQTTPLDMLVLRAEHNHSPCLGLREAACDIVSGCGLVRSEIWACSSTDNGDEGAGKPETCEATTV